MQSAAGPTGPPVAGPTGPPVEGPSGPPATVNPAQFDPLAEIEDARARRVEREDRLEELQGKRNSARVNVYLFLALTVVLAGFAFFPVASGYVDDNPQSGMSKVEAEQWVTDGNADDHVDKIWDGAGEQSGVAWKNIYIPPPLPDMGDTSAVRVDVTVVSYRYSGSSHFKAGLFDGNCGPTLPAHETLPTDAWYHGTENFSALEAVEFTLHAQPGQKCFLIEWDEPMESQTLATMDVAVSMYWPRMMTVPAATITFLLSVFAFIGAQRTGKAFKTLKYPEGPAARKIEEEVIDAAEAEHRGEQLGVPEVEVAEDADAKEVEGPSLAEAAASPEQDDIPGEQEAAPAEQESAAEAWTDEQLLGAGWSQDQIDAMRQG